MCNHFGTAPFFYCIPPVLRIKKQEFSAEGEPKSLFLMWDMCTLSWHASVQCVGMPKHLLRILDACSKLNSLS